ncbi:MAG TPA: DUF4209 domain-containing protein [Candidatus Saccharimonadales bacterium]|nr:DUF4209 domain-containing protein [Candidatus Saccharimonadales bacterium]
MLFDELPAALDVDDIERACLQVAPVETASAGTLHAFGDALNKRGTELRVEDDRAGLLMIADGLVCQLWLGNEASVTRWGGAALVPMMEMPDGVFPPPVGAFPATLLPYLERRGELTTRPDAQARYYDFLWLRRRSYLDARAAIQAYLRADVRSDPTDATERTTPASYLIRAAELSLALNFERAETADVVIGEMRASVDDAGGGFIWQIGQKLGGLAADQPEAAAHLLDELVAAADAAKPDPNHERTLLSTAASIASALGRRADVDAARRAEAESWEREATSRADEGAMTEMAILHDALRAFERIGDGPAVQRLKDRYGEAATRATNELTPMSAEVQIPTELLDQVFEAATTAIRAGDVGLLRFPISMGLWPSWEDVRARFEKARQEHPIEWLASRFTLTSDGRVIGPPEDEAERNEAYLHDFFTREIQMLFGLNHHLIGRLRESGDWSAEAIMANLRLADDELAAASESGIRAFEAGDSWTACHVLIPQFERGLRKVAVMLSANVRRLVADQGIQVATLGPILADDAMIGFLGANLAQTMVAVFTEPRGLNVRNAVAHGLLDPDGDSTGTALLAVAGVLTAGYGLYLLRRAADDSAAGATADADGSAD